MPVGEPEHRLTLECPTRNNVLVAAPGEVDQLAVTGGGDETDLGRPPGRAQELNQEPLAVGRPLVRLVTVGVGVVDVPGQYGPALARIQIEDLELGSFLEVCDLLAVG